MHLIRVVIALALVAPMLPAQSPTVPAWPVASGSRVRISSATLGDDKQVGVAVSATQDTLSFQQEKQPAYTAVATPNIRQLDISQGTHTRRLKGGLLGFLVGAASGAAIGAATWTKPSCGGGALFCGFLDTRATDAAIGGVLGGVLGGVAGILFGGRAVETWVPVAVPRR
jgi:hypothetical protein